MVKMLIASVLALLGAAMCVAEDPGSPSGDGGIPPSTKAMDDGRYRRLCAFEPNSVVWRFTDGDDNALRVHYSFKYLLMPRDKLAADCKGAERDVFFSYKGEFDFYLGQRDSSPVINRTSNPAFHYRWKPGNPLISDWVVHKYWDVGVWEHRSNGQATEVKSPADRQRAIDAFQRSDHRFFDTVSRGSNYTSAETRFDWDKSHDDHYENNLWAKVKVYWSQDSAVTWDPSRSSVSISDYDRAKLIYQRNGLFGSKSEASFSLILGDKGFGTASADIDLLLNKDWALPWYIKVHSGPMFTLSDYTRRVGYVGVGWKLVP